MLTTRAQLHCKCIEYSESFVSLWLQIIWLPLLCRRYQQTLEISRGTWPTVLLFSGNFPWYMTDSTAVLELQQSRRECYWPRVELV